MRTHTLMHTHRHIYNCKENKIDNEYPIFSLPLSGALFPRLLRLPLPLVRPLSSGKGDRLLDLASDEDLLFLSSDEIKQHFHRTFDDEKKNKN